MSVVSSPLPMSVMSMLVRTCARGPASATAGLG
jgi:hypothetical protein